MPNTDRFDWHERVKAVEREYYIAQLALERLRGDVTGGRVTLSHPLRDRDLPATVGGLEGTYSVRLYSVFEAALRSYWATVKQTDPPTTALIDGVATKRHVAADDTAAVHEVRLWRNELVHELQGGIQPIPLREVRGRLQKFLKWLPDQW